MRAKVAVEHDKRNSKDSIIVQEIPYQVNKSRLIESIADLVGTKQVEGITDLRDESDKDGMRIVIEVRKGDEPQVVLNQLYKHTQLQATASIIMLALVNNAPRVLSLADMVRHYVQHRAEIIERRTEFDLAPGRGPRPHRRRPAQGHRPHRRGHRASSGLRTTRTTPASG